MTSSLRELRLGSWRQFRRVEIAFHDRLTVLTGANGSGKTTILNVLSQNLGWSPAFIGTLKVTKKGAFKYFSGVEDDRSEGGGTAQVGALVYGDGTSAAITVPREGEAYQVNLSNAQRLPGVYLTSHRPVYSYQKVTEIPTQVQAGNQLFEQYLNNIRQYYQPKARIESPSHRLKAALISLANFGYGNPVVEPNADARETFEGFSRVLSSVLPPDIGFNRLAIRMPEVILECDSGDFSLDAASGGIAALVDVAWQIYMVSRTAHQFVVVMDEPENHLHPRLQRSVLPGLLEAFPSAQFIVATHNPFVVTSVRDSVVIVLDFVEGRVESSHLDEVDRSASANQVLSDVLGVPSPVPAWVEAEVERVARSVEGEELTSELIGRVRSQLDDVGLGRLLPEVIDHLLPESASEGERPG